jgi:hypothetical protein
MLGLFRHKHDYRYVSCFDGYRRQERIGTVEVTTYEMWRLDLCRCGGYRVGGSGYVILGEVPPANQGDWGAMAFWLRGAFHPKCGLVLRSVHPNTVDQQTRKSQVEKPSR